MTREIVVNPKHNEVWGDVILFIYYCYSIRVVYTFAVYAVSPGVTQEDGHPLHLPHAVLVFIFIAIRSPAFPFPPERHG